jgi:charged multivesicular body protein 4
MASWGFGSLWGGNAAKKKDSTKNAILGLRSTLEMLSKREKHLQNQMDEQDAIARKNVSTNKGGKFPSNRLLCYMAVANEMLDDKPKM